MVTIPSTPRVNASAIMELRGDRRKAVGWWVKDDDPDAPEVITVHALACRIDTRRGKCTCAPAILRRGATA